jgi:hypothetical protein
VLARPARAPRLAAVAAALVAVSVALSGCGGGKNHKSVAPTTTRYPPTRPVQNEQLGEGTGACALLSQSEITSTVGVAVNPGSGTRTKTNEECRWSTRSGSNQFVAVIVTPTGRQQFEQAQNQLGAQAEPLPGVGDRAFVANDTAYALKGERLVIVVVSTSQAIASRKQAATKLITGAVGRG